MKCFYQMTHASMFLALPDQAPLVPLTGEVGEVAKGQQVFLLQGRTVMNLTIRMFHQSKLHLYIEPPKQPCKEQPWLSPAGKASWKLCICQALSNGALLYKEGSHQLLQV